MDVVRPADGHDGRTARRADINARLDAPPAHHHDGFGAAHFDYLRRTFDDDARKMCIDGGVFAVQRAGIVGARNGRPHIDIFGIGDRVARKPNLDPA
jgi:hypothetical protein